MKFLLDPTTIFGCIGILILLLQALMFAIIKFNDLKHLGIVVKNISSDIKEINDKISDVKERIARIEGALEVKDEN